MASITIGDGVRNIAYFLMFSAMAATFFYFGKDYEQGNIKDMNLEVMNVDSKSAIVISDDTKKQQESLNEKLDNLEDPIIDDGYVSLEFMRIVRSEKSDAEQRGDETGIIRTITGP